MKPAIGHYVGGLLHGLAIGIVLGWLLNSGYVLKGSTEPRLLFPAAIAIVMVGNWYNRRAVRAAALNRQEDTGKPKVSEPLA